MATKIFYFTGIANWPKLATPDQRYGHFGLDLHLDEASRELFDQSELTLKVRDHDELPQFVKVRRDPTKEYKGVEQGPPLVLDHEGNEMDPALVGSGSTVTCKVSVYDSRNGKAHNLEAVRVDELVEANRIEVFKHEGDAGAPF